MNKNLILYASMAIMLTFGACRGKGDAKPVEDTTEIAVEVQQSQKIYDTLTNVTSESLGNQAGEMPETEAEKQAKPVIYKKIISNGKPSVIDFSAVWCQPCRMMKPIFDKMAGEFGNEINFISIDVDENKALAEKYQIQSIPAFIFLDEDGNESNRVIGAVGEDELRKEIASGIWR